MKKMLFLFLLFGFVTAACAQNTSGTDTARHHGAVMGKMKHKTKHKKNKQKNKDRAFGQHEPRRGRHGQKQQRHAERKQQQQRCNNFGQGHQNKNEG